MENDGYTIRYSDGVFVPRHNGAGRLSALGRSLKFAPKRGIGFHSKEPAKSIGHALTSHTSDTLRTLCKGVHLQKISKNGNSKKCLFRISDGNLRFSVTKKDSKKGMMADIQKKLGDEKPTIYTIVDVSHVYTGFVGSIPCESYFESTNSSEKDEVSKKILTIFLRDHKTLDFIVEEDNIRNGIRAELIKLKKSFLQSRIFVPREELLMKYAWNDVRTDKYGLFNKSGMKVLLKHFNLSEEAFLKKMKNHSKSYSLKEFMNYLHELKIPPGSEETIESKIWKDAFGDVKLISKDDFINFQRNVQNERSKTDKELEMAFEYMSRMDVSAQEEDLPDGKINKFQFEAFLFSHFNHAYDYEMCQVDFTKLHKPLSHYYINSSHNTYLKGDQLTSRSSVQMYLEALQRGCVCLEIDTWDGQLDTDGTPIPVVYHGYTLTSKIRFIDVVKCINGYMENNSNTYPIILSFENHCSKPYNEVIARNLKDVLGDKLYIPPPDTDFSSELPSPFSLMNKVIVKGKRPPGPEEIDEEFDEKIKAENLTKDDINELEKKREEAKKLFYRIAPELSEITLINGVKFKNFETSLKISNFSMHAISEGNHSKILSESPEMTQKWRQYNTNHMTRAYPKATRVTSSNYSPMIPLALGCQMVALNFQEKCSNMMINDGLFRTNGNCGYVPQPDWLKDIETCRYDKKPCKLKIKILRGSCLPKLSNDMKAVSPVVKVTLHDVNIAFDEPYQTAGENNEKNATRVKTDFKSKSAKTNGFSPFWGNSEWEFTVQNKDIAMLEVSIRHEFSKESIVKTNVKKTLQGKLKTSNVSTTARIADSVVPVRYLKEGFRYLNLYDKYGQTFTSSGQASLLVEIRIDASDK